MSEATTTTQTAVDAPDAAAKPAAEVTTDARTDGDDLDKLLSEFDSSKPKASTEPAKPEPTGAASDLKALTDEVRGMRSERQQEVFKRDMAATIKDVRGNLDPEFYDDALVEAWINAQATSDPRLSQAWINRHDNPKQFAKVVDQLGRNFAKKYGKLPDKQATEDREAVTAAVRGASTKAPEGKAPEYGRMTDAEFAAEKARMWG